jgi:hypothetical protein
MSFFSVFSCTSSLWWRIFGDLFDFLGYLPQRIVDRVCWSEALQENLYAVGFISVEKLFKFPCCCVE